MKRKGLVTLGPVWPALGTHADMGAHKQSSDLIIIIIRLCGQFKNVEQAMALLLVSHNYEADT